MFMIERSGVGRTVRANNSNKVLLVIDVQSEFANDVSHLSKIVRFVEKARLESFNGGEYRHVWGTLCVNDKNSPFVKYGHWFDCMGEIKAPIVPCEKFFIKNGYGLPNYDILPKEFEYHLVGYNTDACVLKIALDLFDLGYNFKVLTEYCYSSNGEAHHNRGVELMRDLFPGAIDVFNNHDNVNDDTCEVDFGCMSAEDKDDESFRLLSEFFSGLTDLDDTCEISVNEPKIINGGPEKIVDDFKNDDSDFIDNLDEAGRCTFGNTADIDKLADFFGADADGISAIFIKSPMNGSKTKNSTKKPSGKGSTTKKPGNGTKKPDGGNPKK